MLIDYLIKMTKIMHTKKVIIIAVILLSPVLLVGQSNKQGEYLSINFQTGYLIPQNTGGAPEQALKGGYEIRPSVYKKMSQHVTVLFEFIYSEHKYKTAQNKGLYIDRVINIGFRIYPRAKEQIYLKPTIGYSLNENYNSFPNLNFGVGNDFGISKKIDLFAEAEIFFKLYSGYTVSFSFSGGIKYKFL